jgi:hypothetical protein
MGHSKSSLLLMELIISILFFSLASTVCIQLFVRSHTLSSDTVALNNAIIQVQNIAELYSHSDGNLNSIRSYYPDARLDETEKCLNIYYDEAWNTSGVTEADAFYYATIVCEDADEENNINATINIGYNNTSAVADTKNIYELKLMHHIAFTLGDISNEQ